MTQSPATPPRSVFIDQHVAYIEKLVAQGGPEPSEYAPFQQWLAHIAKEHRTETLSDGELGLLRDAFGTALSANTLQGFCFQKPHGHAGDFEIIDRLYTAYVTEDPAFHNWDRFFQSRSAAAAVRNRKHYFQHLVEALVRTAGSAASLPILNLASGPGRDIFEFFTRHPETSSVHFECVDNDADAIAYARTLCSAYLDRITFEETNALRYDTNTRFTLVWSAGLFDYLSDKGFQFLLERLLRLLRDDGELVVGNFSPQNPTRPYMEVVADWHLHYRTADQLIELTKGCGVAEADIRVGSEPEGINLFLHVKRGADFLPVDPL